MGRFLEAGGVKAFLDTHAAVALASGETSAFGTASRELLERSALFVSPIVLLELQFLQEIGRLLVAPGALIADLERSVGLVISRDRVEDLVTAAVPIGWTRDPFDRLLVATAVLHRAPFVTRDASIRKHFPQAVW